MSDTTYTASIEFDVNKKYALLFDKSNLNWSGLGDYNTVFVTSTARYLQHKLAIQGFLFVNDVLEAYGFDPTPEGQVVGWLRSDGYIAIEVEPAKDDPKSLWIKFEPQGIMVKDISSDI